MNRKRTESPVFARQWSGGSSSTGSSSPTGSPAHPRSRLPPAATGMSTIKRTQNVAAKAAAQRLARVMIATKTTNDEDEDDDDLDFGFRPPPPISSNNNISRSDSGNISSGLSGIPLSRPNRSPSPSLGRNMDISPSVRSTSAGRPSISVHTATTAVLASKPSLKTPVIIPPIEPPPYRQKDKRFTPDVGHVPKDSGSRHETSALRDEVWLLRPLKFSI